MQYNKTYMLERKRRLITVLISAATLLVLGLATGVQEYFQVQEANTDTTTAPVVLSDTDGSAEKALAELPTKGRAPKTGYAREQFGAGWAAVDACDMRNYILQRDLKHVQLNDKDQCTVESGTLGDPYTDKEITFKRGASTSRLVQIDHVVALSDAWQKGAQTLDVARRAELANDPLNLLAVDGPANAQKSDSDAASWLPPNKAYRCQYVARQIAVKQKYNLWITAAERDTMVDVLASCPGQMLPSIQ